MKVKPLGSFKSKFLKPCTKFFNRFKHKLRKSFLIRRTLRFRFRPRQPRNNRSTALVPNTSRSLSQSGDMDRLVELKSVPSPRITTVDVDAILHSPAYSTFQRDGHMRRPFPGNDDVEDACRSFENYLVQMIVEEGKMKDLMDVEELLYCWKNLKSPVFVDLVSTFYGELCKDLFSTNHDDDAE